MTFYHFFYTEKCYPSKPLSSFSMFHTQIFNPRTQGKCDIWVTTVYLPQVSSGTHLLSSPKVGMNNWVSYKPTAPAGIQIHAPDS